MKKILHIVLGVAAAALLFLLLTVVLRYLHEKTVLRQVIERLEATSRAAEVMVTKVEYDETTKQNLTTIKFLEYDAQGKPLTAKYFTFTGNIIQFQSLVIRFGDDYVRRGDQLRGKSAYIFWKAFMLDGQDTEEFIITPFNTVPAGYKIARVKDSFEKKLWEEFWHYALDNRKAKKMGIKTAQIEAPGTAFVPGALYTIKIEHNGGLRIEAAPLPNIVRGETVPR